MASILQPASLVVCEFSERICYTGMPVTSVRELRVLQQCKHPNLVELKKVVTGSKLDRCVLAYYMCGIAIVLHEALHFVLKHHSAGNFEGSSASP